ncbi:MAG: nucleotidyltransferase domain-containing protein [Candidatus Methanoplasma sp.]|nr:nucleotidyltransferase domain-containing protein [Candidatus Methanoplasma sp.]
MPDTVREIHTVGELKEIVAPVAETHGVSKVYLFGSAARGDYNDGGDYDFCIEKGELRGLTALSGFFQDLRDAVGRDVDLVTTKTSNKDLLSAVMSEEVVIYER